MTNTTPYYVIRRPATNHYCGGPDNDGYPWQLTAKTARRFSSIFDAAVACINLKGAPDKSQYEIVRVEETPGTSSTVIMHQTQLDTTKPCVIKIMHPRHHPFATQADLRSWDENIRKAHVFADLGDALLALGKREAFNSPGCIPKEIKVFNVEVVKAEPTIIETALK